MNLGVYYILSSKILSRWQHMLAFQSRILPAWNSLKKLFIVDRDWTEAVPGEIIRTDCFQGKLIKFSYLKNIGLKWAEERGFEWALDCDADTAILKLPTVYPESGYGTMLCYLSQQGETDESIVQRWNAGTLNFRACSRFLLRRDIFSKFHYDERVVGYGGEDLDYHKNILGRAGISNTHSDARGIHFWHTRPTREDSGTMDYFEKKSAISDAREAAAKIEGWMHPDELHWLAEQAIDRAVIVEMGSWKGRSTKALAMATKGRVYAVDHWKGSSNPEDATTVEIKKRGPNVIFNEFSNNLAGEIKLKKVIPIYADSDEGARTIRQMHPEGVDMVFIDGDHEYESVRRDLRSFMPLLKPGGLLCGHDLCPIFPGVGRALGELVPGHHSVIGSIWRAP